MNEHNGNEYGDIALRAQGVRKIFEKNKKQKGFTLSLPWHRRKNESDDTKEIVVALDNIDLEVRRHEIFGILGPNGSGKSTLIRLISTLMLADDGVIEVFGYDVEREEMAVKELINRVSVEASFFKKLSPMENLVFGARLYGVPASESRPKIQEILKRLGLREDAIFHPMEQMSRGMQQKVAVARAFLTAPILLLLDEPTTGLDPRSKRDVQDFVLELRDIHDATVLLTTHDMYEADKLCDRVAIIDRGHIVAQGTPQQLKAMVDRRNGHEPTLEDVFMELTGRELVKTE